PTRTAAQPSQPSAPHCSLRDPARYSSSPAAARNPASAAAPDIAPAAAYAVPRTARTTDCARSPGAAGETPPALDYSSRHIAGRSAATDRSRRPPQASASLAANASAVVASHPDPAALQPQSPPDSVPVPAPTLFSAHTSPSPAPPSRPLPEPTSFAPFPSPPIKSCPSSPAITNHGGVG